MQVPTIGHTQFCILSALLDGRALSISELVERLEWDKCRETLIKLSAPMHQAGLIAKSDELLRGGRTRRVYHITDDGKWALREASDFYLTMIERFQHKPASKSTTPAAVLSRRKVKVKPSTGPSSPERIATPAEFERLMIHAEECFARAYRVLWTLNASVQNFERGVSALEVIGLQIADTDLEAGTLIIQGRPLLMDDLSQTAIRDAAGDREQGCLFLTSNGRPFVASVLAGSFRTAARKAGLPKEVKLIGRANSWRHRQNVNH